MKEAASAAHTYGKTTVAAEGMTSIGPQWEESIWNNLKPSFDQAVCSGLNLLFCRSTSDKDATGEFTLRGTGDVKRAHVDVWRPDTGMQWVASDATVRLTAQ